MQYAFLFRIKLTSQELLSAPIVKLTLTFAQLTEDGLNSRIGLSARMNAEDIEVGAEVVPTLPQKMEVLIAMGTIRSHYSAPVVASLMVH